MDIKEAKDNADNLATAMQKGMLITVSRNSWKKSEDEFRRAVVIRLVTGDYFNVNGVSIILKKAWNMKDAEVSFEEIPGNMAVAKFRNKNKLEEVLEGGPWTFQNQIICIKKWIIGCKPENLDFNKLHIWVQIHNIPREYMDDEVTKEIAEGIGRIVKIQADDIGVKKRKFARYMIEIDINHEIPEGAYIELDTGEIEPFWVNFRFERLQIQCSRCRNMKHKFINCPYGEDVL